MSLSCVVNAGSREKTREIEKNRQRICLSLSGDRERDRQREKENERERGSVREKLLIPEKKHACK